MKTKQAKSVAKPETTDLRRVAQAATLKMFSVASLHAEILQPPEKSAAGTHKFSIKTEVTAETLDEKSAEVFISLNIGIHRTEPEPPWVTFSSRVRLVYDFSSGVPERIGLDEFARTNGLYNAWPFLRELVQSTTMRMGIAPLMLPMFRINRQTPALPVKKDVVSIQSRRQPRSTSR